MTAKAIPSLLILVTALSAAGCASMSLPFGGKEKVEVVRATQANPVMETVSLWEAAEGRGLDNLPTRGFAGQLLFFTYKHPTPALVDGNVTVYVFDNVGSENDQSKPLWQHTFAPHEWNSFSLQTNLGTAYQVFIPYTRKGLHEAHCSLRIKYEPTDGSSPVYSKMANVTLSGGKKDKSDPPKSTITRNRIEPERFAAAATVEPLPKPLRSSTVALPGGRRVDPQTAAHLQQVAHEMLQAQQATRHVEQAAYSEPAAADDADDDSGAPPASRYNLYR